MCAARSTRPAAAADSFVFSKDIGGGEFYQLYRYDEATGAVTLLTDGKSRNTDEVWSNDGKQLAYGSTRRDGKDVDIWLSEPAHPDDPKTNRLLAQNDRRRLGRAGLVAR